MEDLEQYSRYSPFMTALIGRDESAKADLYRRFSALPEEIAETLTSPDTADKIKSWESEGIFPSTHSSAVAKLIALSILGIIQSNQIPALLEKLNLDSVTRAQTSAVIMTIVGPALSFIEGYNQPTSPEVGANTPSSNRAISMNEMPPLTQRVPPPAPSSDSSKPPARNIIDLRKQQPEQ